LRIEIKFQIGKKGILLVMRWLSRSRLRSFSNIEQNRYRIFWSECDSIVTLR